MKATIQEEWKEDYQRIEQAIRYLEQNFREQPSLTEVASAVHLSPFHFQRLFTRWAGISPKRFVQFLTMEHAKSLLKESASVLDASLESGLSGPGRLHDLFVSLEAVSPGEFKEGGKGIEIAYGFCTSPFGECLMASTERGLCHLSFIREAGRGERIVKLQRNWPHARLVENPEALREPRDRVFSEKHRTGNSIGLIVRGTNFQIRVWRALLEIPAGSLQSYQDLANRLEIPSAVRAVASAVGANPISYLIPCHRVVRKSGHLGGYDGGLLRKRALIGWESARQEAGWLE